MPTLGPPPTGPGCRKGREVAVAPPGLAAWLRAQAIQRGARRGHQVAELSACGDAERPGGAAGAAAARVSAAFPREGAGHGGPPQPAPRPQPQLFSEPLGGTASCLRDIAVEEVSAPRRLSFSETGGSGTTGL